MRVLFYSSNPNLSLKGNGGYATHMNEMIRAFEEKGHIVEKLVMGDQAQSVDSGVSSAQRFLKNIIPGKIWRTLKDRRILVFDKHAKSLLLDRIQSFKPDLIYERVSLLQVSGAEAARENNIMHFLEVNAPTVDEAYGLEKSTSFLKNKAYEIEKRQFRLTDRILPVSAALGKWIREKYQVKDDKLIINQNGIRSEYPVDHKKRIVIKEKWGIREDDLIIGFVGFIFQWHRIDHLLKAFGKIKNKNVRLMIVGDGTDGKIRAELNDLITSHKRKDDILFVGRVQYEDIFNYVELMDICVSPNNLWYMSPLKLFEYAALQKAIVAPNTEAIKEVFTHEHDAVLITPGVENLSNAIQRLVDDQDLRTKLAANAKSGVLENHTWTSKVDKILPHINPVKN